MDKKELARNRKQRQRDRERVTLDSVTPHSVTLNNGVYIDRDKAIKLAKIHNSLNQRIHGLCGEENMLDLVRYGTFSMRAVGIALVTGEVT